MLGIQLLFYEEGYLRLQLVYLKGSYDLIWSRMEARTNHFMKPHMLKSQFETLEEPKNALVIDIERSIEEIMDEILKVDLK